LGIDTLFENTTVGGTPATELRFRIPASKIAARQMMSVCHAVDNGTNGTGSAYVTAGGVLINFTKTAGTAWSASTNATTVFGQLTFEIE
jgi:hypothetical protein